MKEFIVGFRMCYQYRRHPVVAETEEEARELVKHKYKKLSISGTAEMLETLPEIRPLSCYWIKE